MEIYAFFVEVMQGMLSVLSRIKVGSSSLLGVLVAAALIGMIVRSFVLTSK